ncbi:MAG: hypothetical protein BroJett011_13940 [Chloroflexota bacterium]|nr:MAG: hypothetical protein BroJett011_13940 [Chloroflexota bacterium]
MVIARATRVIIPGRRLLSSATAPFRKGQPPHQKMKLERRGAIQVEPEKAGG